MKNANNPSEIHVTKILSNGDVWGHETKHCDEGGCADAGGADLFWSGLAGRAEVGEIAEMPIHWNVRVDVSGMDTVEFERSNAENPAQVLDSSADGQGADFLRVLAVSAEEARAIVEPLLEDFSARIVSVTQYYHSGRERDEIRAER